MYRLLMNRNDNYFQARAIAQGDEWIKHISPSLILWPATLQFFTKRSIEKHTERGWGHITTLLPRVNWDWHPVRNIDSFFNELSWEDWQPAPSITGWKEGISISEDDENYYFEAALPGVERDDITVSVDKGSLNIHGQTDREEKDRQYLRHATSSFSYRITLPDDASGEPQASQKNGIIKVTFKKSQKSQPKIIEVKSEDWSNSYPPGQSGQVTKRRPGE